MCFIRPPVHASTFLQFPGPGVVLWAEAPEIKRGARGTKEVSAGGAAGGR